MRDTASCPVCHSEEWTPLERFHYQSTDSESGPSSTLRQLLAKARVFFRILLLARPTKSVIRFTALNDYHRRRRRVLFDVWFPGFDSVELTSVICPSCDFMCYLPRPSTESIRDKYLALRSTDASQDGPGRKAIAVSTEDQERAERIFESLKHFRRPGPARVLDYGGGNGKLLTPFLKAGDQCDLIDYNDRQLPGIRKIADDIEGYDGDGGYDIILCNHVLEHVAEPRELLEALGRLLGPTGVVYAEIPLEVWSGPRLEADPVTHVNFFTHSSLNALVRESGFTMLGTRTGQTYYGSQPIEVAWVVASRYASAETRARPETEIVASSNLFPSRWQSLKRMWTYYIKPMLGPGPTSIPLPRPRRAGPDKPHKQPPVMDY